MKEEVNFTRSKCLFMWYKESLTIIWDFTKSRKADILFPFLLSLSFVCLLKCFPPPLWELTNS